MPNDTDPFYGKVLSEESNIFEACTMTWPPLKKTIWAIEHNFCYQEAGCHLDFK